MTRLHIICAAGGDPSAYELDGVDLNLAYGFNLGQAIQLGFSLRTYGRMGESTDNNVVGTEDQ